MKSWQSLLKRLVIKGMWFHYLRLSFATYTLLLISCKKAQKKQRFSV
jgi:hypothetical protein